MQTGAAIFQIELSEPLRDDFDAVMSVECRSSPGQRGAAHGIIQARRAGVLCESPWRNGMVRGI